MGILLEQVEKAKARSAGLDLEQLAKYSRDKPPAELSTPKQLADREAFLRESLGGEKDSAIVFERIINGSELQDANYLARGARAAKAVARVVMRDSSGRLRGYGSGFLIAPGVLITNNHVLPGQSDALRSEAQFDFELDIDGRPIGPVTYALDAASLFFTSGPLDFTVVGVVPRATNDEAELSRYGCLPLVGTLGKAVDGEWLSIVQHPNGERKQLCVRENQLLKRQDDVLWYASDTLGGSSGSPVFNNDWYVVALHHSGVPEERDGHIQTIYGRAYDPARGDGEQDIKWIANEGIRVSRIVETLKAALPDHPLLQRVYGATPENARLLPASSSKNASTPRSVTVTLGIDAAGGVSVLSSGAASQEVALVLEAAKKKAKPPAFDVPFNAAYDDRKGYAPDFLAPKKIEVQLPKLSTALEAAAASLIKPEAKNKHVLRYHNYSLVMHAKRRFAIYSAANVDFGGRFEMSRPPDVWRQDPRIALEAQVTNFYYTGNQFDRGHLTRREDLEFGRTRKDALISAADTCHWSNCTPQHAQFNQNKELWQGIERHLLEDAITRDNFRAQVLTGPILEESDPAWKRYPQIQYPVRFWKVVAAVNAAGKLFATAYILDQSAVIAQFGIEEAAPAVPFTAYKTFQVPIEEVERLTQLSFTGGPPGAAKPLSSFDPLKAAPARRRARRPAVHEAASVDTDVPEAYVPLGSLEDIRR